MSGERKRLAEAHAGKSAWQKWGPYVAERQWGTVREDYSADGNAWEYFPHDAARSRAYRWGEDGIAGICDRDQLLCFAPALWNGKDPILKERLFGLAGNEGNHGEDVKECYYYLDNTPTHSYMKMLYKYPLAPFPYLRLVQENRLRGKTDPEFELIDSGVFGDDRYADLFVEYAKAGPEDILVRFTVTNRGQEVAVVHLLPMVWFRNTWSWGYSGDRPAMRAQGNTVITLEHSVLGTYRLYCDEGAKLLFCENDSHPQPAHGVDGGQTYFKDGINDYIVAGDMNAVNPRRRGTKAAAHYRLSIDAGATVTVRLRLSTGRLAQPFRGFDAILTARKREADEFYAELQQGVEGDDARAVQRQALAGMLWTKQFYYWDIPQWLKGDPAMPPPPAQRLHGRNHEWLHLNNADVISMPDKWEYPWYASWDLAFHCIPLAMLDPEFAKAQLVLFTREWYMHPNGQLPAYEWALSDANPPVHAWAAWRVYEIDRALNKGRGDTDFLERVFHKLLLNFTWWVNRKDTEGHNIFQGGFLGLDNIGVFDRSSPLPTGGNIEQTDATGWMAMYSLNLMRIALELALTKPLYQDLATKFFEHFLYIAGAMANIGGQGINLWDEEDEFFYDVLHTPDDKRLPLKVRSLVSLIPLFAVEVLDPEGLKAVPEFEQRLEWFLNYRPDLAGLVSRWKEPGAGERRLLSLLRGHRMKRLLRRMLDESEFLSEHGVRSLSRYHEHNPYVFHADGQEFTVEYHPGESATGLFGGNSNWRGPVWFPVNFLIIESLLKFHQYYGDDFKVECPTGSGQLMTIAGVAHELARRLTGLFLRDGEGHRPVFGTNEKLRTDPQFRDYIPFFEYFHGETGAGLGASHQTGWTGLVAGLFAFQKEEEKKPPQRKGVPVKPAHRRTS